MGAKGDNKHSPSQCVALQGAFKTTPATLLAEKEPAATVKGCQGQPGLHMSSGPAWAT